MTKRESIEARQADILNYINTFKDSKCYQPVSRIAQMLGLSKKQCRTDITNLLEKGTIYSEHRKIGFRNLRCLVGDANVAGTFKLPEIELEAFKYDGYNYKLPTALPRGGYKGMVTNYNQRPKRNGKAIAIDWEYWDKQGLVNTPTNIPIDPHFPPFDDKDYITTTY